MLRFYRQYIEHVLFALVGVREGLGRDGFPGLADSTYAAWRRRTPANEEERKLVRVLTHTWETTTLDQSLTDLINVAVDAVYAAQNGTENSNDKELIDTIVQCIQLPFAKNRLSGESLERLKSALLLPDETVGLRERLKAEEFSCSLCGHAFRSGEMTTFMTDRNIRNGSPSIVCVSCAHPQYIPCSGGKHHMPAPKGLASQIVKEQGKTCLSCQSENELETLAAGGERAPARPPTEAEDDPLRPYRVEPVVLRGMDPASARARFGQQYGIGGGQTANTGAAGNNYYGIYAPVMQNAAIPTPTPIMNVIEDEDLDEEQEDLDEEYDQEDE